MYQTSWYVSGHLQQVSRCLQHNPSGIIGCGEPCGMSLDVSSRSPGVSSIIPEVSLDVVNVNICLAKAPASLQRTPGGIIGCSEHQHMSCKGSSESPGGIMGCSEHRHLSCAGSSQSPGVSNRLPEISLDVVNLMVCLWTSPAGLQVSPADSRRYH